MIEGTIMTRDQAVRILVASWAPCTDAFGLVHALESLGVLKLDQPKPLPQKLRDFVMDARLAQGDAMDRLSKLQRVLDDCGLKITDADEAAGLSDDR